MKIKTKREKQIIKIVILWIMCCGRTDSTPFAKFWRKASGYSSEVILNFEKLAKNTNGNSKAYVLDVNMWDHVEKYLDCPSENPKYKINPNIFITVSTEGDKDMHVGPLQLEKVIRKIMVQRAKTVHFYELTLGADQEGVRSYAYDTLYKTITKSLKDEVKKEAAEIREWINLIMVREIYAMKLNAKTEQFKSLLACDYKCRSDKEVSKVDNKYNDSDARMAWGIVIQNKSLFLKTNQIFSKSVDESKKILQIEHIAKEKEKRQKRREETPLHKRLFRYICKKRLQNNDSNAEQPAESENNIYWTPVPVNNRSMATEVEKEMKNEQISKVGDLERPEGDILSRVFMKSVVHEKTLDNIGPHEEPLLTRNVSDGETMGNDMNILYNAKEGCLRHICIDIVDRVHGQMVENNSCISKIVEEFEKMDRDSIVFWLIFPIFNQEFDGFYENLKDIHNIIAALNRILSSEHMADFKKCKLFKLIEDLIVLEVKNNQYMVQILESIKYVSSRKSEKLKNKTAQIFKPLYDVVEKIHARRISSYSGAEQKTSVSEPDTQGLPIDQEASLPKKDISDISLFKEMVKELKNEFMNRYQEFTIDQITKKEDPVKPERKKYSPIIFDDSFSQILKQKAISGQVPRPIAHMGIQLPEYESVYLHTDFVFWNCSAEATRLICSVLQEYYTTVNCISLKCCKVGLDGKELSTLNILHKTKKLFIITDKTVKNIGSITDTFLNLEVFGIKDGESHENLPGKWMPCYPCIEGIKIYKNISSAKAIIPKEESEDADVSSTDEVVEENFTGMPNGLMQEGNINPDKYTEIHFNILEVDFFNEETISLQETPPLQETADYEELPNSVIESVLSTIQKEYPVQFDHDRSKVVYDEILSNIAKLKKADDSTRNTIKEKRKNIDKYGLDILDSKQALEYLQDLSKISVEIVNEWGDEFICSDSKIVEMYKLRIQALSLICSKKSTMKHLILDYRTFKESLKKINICKVGKNYTKMQVEMGPAIKNQTDECSKKEEKCMGNLMKILDSWIHMHKTKAELKVQGYNLIKDRMEELHSIKNYINIKKEQIERRIAEGNAYSTSSVPKEVVFLDFQVEFVDYHLKVLNVVHDYYTNDGMISKLMSRKPDNNSIKAWELTIEFFFPTEKDITKDFLLQLHNMLASTVKENLYMLHLIITLNEIVDRKNYKEYLKEIATFFENNNQCREKEYFLNIKMVINAIDIDLCYKIRQSCRMEIKNESLSIIENVANSFSRIRNLKDQSWAVPRVIIRNSTLRKYLYGRLIAGETDTYKVDKKPSLRQIYMRLLALNGVKLPLQAVQEDQIEGSYKCTICQEKLLNDASEMSTVQVKNLKIALQRLNKYLPNSPERRASKKLAEEKIDQAKEYAAVVIDIQNVLQRIEQNVFVDILNLAREIAESGDSSAMVKKLNRELEEEAPGVNSCNRELKRIRDKENRLYTRKENYTMKLSNTQNLLDSAMLEKLELSVDEKWEIAWLLSDVLDRKHLKSWQHYTEEQVNYILREKALVHVKEVLSCHDMNRQLPSLESWIGELPDIGSDVAFFAVRKLLQFIEGAENGSALYPYGIDQKNALFADVFVHPLNKVVQDVLKNYPEEREAYMLSIASVDTDKSKYRILMINLYINWVSNIVSGKYPIENRNTDRCMFDIRKSTESVYPAVIIAVIKWAEKQHLMDILRLADSEKLVVPSVNEINEKNKEFKNLIPDIFTEGLLNSKDMLEYPINLFMPRVNTSEQQIENAVCTNTPANRIRLPIICHNRINQKELEAVSSDEVSRNLGSTQASVAIQENIPNLEEQRAESHEPYEAQLTMTSPVNMKSKEIRKILEQLESYLNTPTPKIGNIYNTGMYYEVAPESITKHLNVIDALMKRINSTFENVQSYEDIVAKRIQLEYIDLIYYNNRAIEILHKMYDAIKNNDFKALNEYILENYEEIYQIDINVNTQIYNLMMPLNNLMNTCVKKCRLSKLYKRLRDEKIVFKLAKTLQAGSDDAWKIACNKVLNEKQAQKKEKPAESPQEDPCTTSKKTYTSYRNSLNEKDTEEWRENCRKEVQDIINNILEKDIADGGLQSTSGFGEKKIGKDKEKTSHRTKLLVILPCSHIFCYMCAVHGQTNMTMTMHNDDLRYTNHRYPSLKKNAACPLCKVATKYSQHMAILEDDYDLAVKNKQKYVLWNGVHKYTGHMPVEEMDKKTPRSNKAKDMIRKRMFVYVDGRRLSENGKKRRDIASQPTKIEIFLYNTLAATKSNLNFNYDDYPLEINTDRSNKDQETLMQLLDKEIEDKQELPSFDSSSGYAHNEWFKLLVCRFKWMESKKNDLVLIEIPTYSNIPPVEVIPYNPKKQEYALDDGILPKVAPLKENESSKIPSLITLLMERLREDTNEESCETSSSYSYSEQESSCDSEHERRKDKEAKAYEDKQNLIFKDLRFEDYSTDSLIGSDEEVKEYLHILGSTQSEKIQTDKESERSHAPNEEKKPHALDDILMYTVREYIKRKYNNSVVAIEELYMSIAETLSKISHIMHDITIFDIFSACNSNDKEGQALSERNKKIEEFLNGQISFLKRQNNLYLLYSLFDCPRPNVDYTEINKKINLDKYRREKHKASLKKHKCLNLRRNSIVEKIKEKLGESNLDANEILFSDAFISKDDIDDVYKTNKPSLLSKVAIMSRHSVKVASDKVILSDSEENNRNIELLVTDDSNLINMNEARIELPKHDVNICQFSYSSIPIILRFSAIFKDHVIIHRMFRVISFFIDFKSKKEYLNPNMSNVEENTSLITLLESNIMSDEDIAQIFQILNETKNDEHIDKHLNLQIRAIITSNARSKLVLYGKHIVSFLNSEYCQEINTLKKYTGIAKKAFEEMKDTNMVSETTKSRYCSAFSLLEKKTSILKDKDFSSSLENSESVMHLIKITTKRIEELEDYLDIISENITTSIPFWIRKEVKSYLEKAYILVD
ncbi:hypothetical protein NEAUS03_0833 [Nematocida ausubeli]|nr:hypothetical protein NEAUS03_0833 [Nematocida ausubeli]